MKKTNKAPNQAKNTKKAPEQEEVDLTDAQIDIVLDKFHEHVQMGILDQVFLPHERNGEITDDMIEYVVERAINELPAKYTDKKFAAKVEAIVKEDQVSMAQDLLLNTAKLIIEELEGQEDECPIHGKKPKKGDFNSSRGLN